MNGVKLTEAGREDLAIALILLKDWKSEGRFDLELSRQTLRFARILGIGDEYVDMMSKVPPMKIEER